MRENIVDDITQLFKNKVLNALGVDRDLYELIADGDIDTAIELMQNRDEEVDNAISEYNPQQHKVMFRPNKIRDHDEPYITEKLPRNLQSYINEIELFFLLGQPMEWKKLNGEDEAYKIFKEFIDTTYFNGMMRKVKRLAGAETESALVYNIYQENGKVEVIPFVVARSEGYQLRPLFNQYKQLQAFAYGYQLRESSGHSVQHWDILTKDYLFYSKKSKIGWEIESYDNPIGKIPCIYFHQDKAWFGVEPRLDRIEKLDSQLADTNNYFADPIAEATADVIQSMSTPDKPGRLIQLTGEKSRFGYVAPPSGSQTRSEELRDLKASVLFDTFTPDFDLEKMRGFGTLSGAAIKNTFALAYIKRNNRLETYQPNAIRIFHVIKEILILKNPTKEKILRELEIEPVFADPFASDKEDRWNNIMRLYGAGLMSLETAVNMLAITNEPEKEIDLIHAAAMDRDWVAAEAQGNPQPSDEEQDAMNRGEQPQGEGEQGAEEGQEQPIQNHEGGNEQNPPINNHVEV